MPTVSVWFCHVEISRNVRQRHWHWHATQEMRRKWGDVGPGWPRSVLTPAHVILTSIRNNNRPDPEIFTAGCVCKLTISSGPSETNSRSREIRNRTLMNSRLNNWLRNILVTPGLMPRLVKMLKYPVFWYFTNIPPAARINLTSAHQRGWGWDWESDFHQIKAWHSSYSRPG